MITDIIIVIVCIVALWWGASFIVEASVRIARRLGLSELVIGLTIVAIGTSAPEFAVTAAAAINGQSNISVANVVGSNIFNLGFILGGVALISAITTSRKLVYRDGMMLIGTTFLLLFFLRDLWLQPWEGLIMILLLVAYVSFLFYQRDPQEEELPTGSFTWVEIPRLVFGIALVIAGGHFLVDSAVVIARAIGVSDWVIGVTIVAAGTSAPEMATSFVAVARGHQGISVGNLIGSDLFNMLGVLGFAALIQTGGDSLRIVPAGYTSIMILSGLVVFVVILMRTGWRLTRLEGALLILITLVRWILDFAGDRV
jgi:cation:H+ antiporter